ncbi:MAG: leucine-rich repeat domain-containing protein [Muribaculaceae bacterium]|nr:leucine-rich repeat domain-containing protein [Muribaculaceae bacterium]
MDRPQTSDDILFAVMDNNEVKFESETVPGKLGKGEKISFKASHIADNDNRLEVYANSSRLYSDADGNYNVTLNDNTIIHFDLVAPLAADPNKSVWTLTDKNGSIGMFSDAVNVIPGSEFTVRLNALNVPTGYDQMYWGIALTDSKGNIKEFISPITVWNAGAADNFRLNVNCKVSESTVREGNMLRLVTSFNKKNWNLVYGGSSDIVYALPALNNMTPIYNISVPTVENATVSGVTPTAVRGRDLTLNVTPNSAAYRVNVSLNGKDILKGAPSVSYPFVALEDMEFSIDVYDPREIGSVTYNVKPNELYKAVTAETVAANVIVTGEVYSKDLSLAFRQDFAARTIKRLDLSGVKIVADVLTPTSDNDKFDNFIPSNLLYNPSGVTSVVPVVEEIILPNTVTRIADGAFTNCSRLKEITLPLDLKSEKIEIGRYSSGGIKYGYSLGSQVFKGCTSLTTIRIPGTPSTVNGRVVVSHYNPMASTNSEYNKPDYTMYDLGFRNSENLADGSKITVIVPKEYLGAYKTPYNSWEYGNPWVAQGYNILSENPVYGVDFDPTRVKVTDGTDVSKIAEFLSENVALESMSTEGKLMLTHPEIKSKIFDNGVEISAASDGSIPVTFYNPAKSNEKAGHHRIDVIYTHDIAFSSTSSLFEISTPEVSNEENYTFHDFDTTNPLSPVLRDVAENSLVRFKVSFKDDNEGLEARVMKGAEELSSDADGYYSLSTASGSANIEIFAVPGNGATINSEELAAIKPEESASVTSIALAGEMTADELAYAVECFENLENLDLSGFKGEIPESAFSGMDALTTVVLPEVEEISANMFNGCVNLQSVDIPATVGSVGEGAFKDCGALEKITLTGVSSIGDGAFDGCGNLTVITLLSSSADPSSKARRRTQKKSGRLGSDAFKGVNPNCIVILDDGVEVPAAKANYIKASIGTILETTLDGTQEEREGRVYSADSDITFVEGYPLAIPHKFNIGEGAEVSLEVETGNWTPIVVPFDVETITDGVKEIALAASLEKEDGAENNSVFGLDSESGKLHGVEKIEANIPYFFYTSETGTTTFRTSEGTVAATPAEICVNGKDYSLHATYKEQNLPAADIYLPDANSYAFLPAEAESEEGNEPGVTVSPFTVYASSSLGLPEILTELPGVEKPLETGVENAVSGSFKVTVENGIAIVHTEESCVETVYAADGKAVFTVALKAGRNELNGLSSGIYVIRNIKFAF